MIRLVFGNVGSGKTASMVRFMKNNPQKTFITNINTYGKEFSHVMPLKADMIIEKKIVGEKRNGEAIYKYDLNIDFWKKLLESGKEVSVIIDEGHIFFNSRRAMSTVSKITTEWLALLRRVLGGTDNNNDLTIISQLSRRLDVIVREMATEVIYCVCRYKKICKKCEFCINETNETADKMFKCLNCGSHNIIKESEIIEVWHFTDVENFVSFKDYHQKTYYKHYIINDIRTIFGNYNTLQFDDLFSDF